MKKSVFKFASLDGGKCFCVQKDPIKPNFNNCISLLFKMTSQLTIDCKSCFRHFLKNTDSTNAIETFIGRCPHWYQFIACGLKNIIWLKPAEPMLLTRHYWLVALPAERQARYKPVLCTGIIMGVRPQTNLGGHQIFARKICHCNSISKKKKKVIARFAAPYLLLLD